MLGLLVNDEVGVLEGVLLCACVIEEVSDDVEDNERDEEDVRDTDRDGEDVRDADRDGEDVRDTDRDGEDVGVTDRDGAVVWEAVTDCDGRATKL